MAEPEDTLRNSPVDFDSAVAYALHPEMRRVIGLAIALVGAIFLFGGLVGAAFKLVADANFLAMEQ